MSGTYGKRFYRIQSTSSAVSASHVVQHVLKYIQPVSVVDLGCGVGTWLRAFLDAGVKDVQGIDGPWVNRQMLRIPEEKFMSADLSQPLSLNRTFDLAVSVEVAEHIDASRAASFVQTLTSLAPVVLFSAAIPFQRGRQHINCQWPTYWVDLFGQRGYVAVDALRPLIWDNDDICYWYRQNILFLVKEQYLGKSTALHSAHDCNQGRPLSLVHPEFFLQYADPRQVSLRWLAKNLPTVLKFSLARNLRRLQNRSS